MFVLGTAGHIDHGKTALVHALTGMDPDRLREEKERGMTIDLGFAWLKLPSGKEIGIIDVPGHERFVKNMLAGAGGIDVALLIIAANEGVMPQTREHLAILDLLKIKRGIIVLTKKDTADKDLLEMVTLEAEEIVSGTILDGAPIKAVSSITGEGIQELLGTIDEVLSIVKPRNDIGRPRLLIDRSFSIVGSGTVVTGTLIDGSLAHGQEVEIQPSGLHVRIRALQTHKNKIEQVGPGTRVAANLVGVSPSDISRGDVLTTRGWLIPTKRIDARLQLLPHAKHQLKHGTVLSFHTGAAEAMARIHLLESDELNPGESGLAQFSLVDPIAAVKGDYFIIRSPNDTIGGGQIISIKPQKHKRFREDTIEQLKSMDEGSLPDRILAALVSKQPLAVKTLSIECNIPASEIAGLVKELLLENRVVIAGQGDAAVLMTDLFWHDLTGKALKLASDYHVTYPARPGISKSEVAGKLNLKSLPVIMQKIIDDGLLVEEGAVVRIPSFTVRLTKEQESKIDSFLKSLQQNPFSPPADIMPEPDILSLLLKQKRIIKVSEGVVFSKDAYDEMVRRIIDYGREKGKITAAEVRDLLGTSRKYAIALLEYLDGKKITRRVGDERVIR